MVFSEKHSSNARSLLHEFSDTADDTLPCDTPGISFRLFGTGIPILHLCRGPFNKSIQSRQTRKSQVGIGIDRPRLGAFGLQVE